MLLVILKRPFRHASHVIPIGGDCRHCPPKTSFGACPCMASCTSFYVWPLCFPLWSLPIHNLCVRISIRSTATVAWLPNTGPTNKHAPHMPPMSSREMRSSSRITLVPCAATPFTPLNHLRLTSNQLPLANGCVPRRFGWLCLPRRKMKAGLIHKPIITALSRACDPFNTSGQLYWAHRKCEHGVRSPVGPYDAFKMFHQHLLAAY